MNLWDSTTSAWLLLTCVLALAAKPASGQDAKEAGAVVQIASRNELIQAVRAAKPGTTILVAPGSYEGGLSFENLKGEEGKPIILAAADPQKPPVIDGGATGLHLTDPVYVELRDLIISKSRANGLNIDDGGSYGTPARQVILRRLVVRDVGSDANHDGLKLSGLNDFTVEQCTIERWGKRGSAIDMVGCHRGVIRGCTIREGDAAANGVQMKGGSREIAVRHCRFENAGGRGVNLGGSTGLEYFRPNPEGYEAKDITVADCTFSGSMAPIALVGVDGALVEHNTIFRPTRWVLRILQENQKPEFAPCRNGRFKNNIVVFRSAEVATVVNIGGGTSPETFEFAANLWHCEDMPERTQRLVQLPSAEKDGLFGQAPKFKDAAHGNFELMSGSFEAGPRKEK